MKRATAPGGIVQHACIVLHAVEAPARKVLGTAPMLVDQKPVDQKTRIVAAVLKGIKLPPRFQLRLVKKDPVRLELTLTPAYGKATILVGAG